MKAMVLKNICDFRENKELLEMVNLSDPVPDERKIKIVANVASRDVSEFLQSAATNSH